MKWSEGSSKVFEKPEAGNDIARCIRIIDLGTMEEEWQGTKKHQRKVALVFELPNQLLSEGEYAGKPMTVSKWYTASLDKKASLRRDLTAWRGREFTDEELHGFHSKNILGKACMLSLIENDKGKIIISGISSVPKGFTPAPNINPLVYLSLEPDEFDQAAFDSISDKMKDIIKVSPEYKELMAGKKRKTRIDSDDFEDDIPF